MNEQVITAGGADMISADGHLVTRMDKPCAPLPDGCRALLKVSGLHSMTLEAGPEFTLTYRLYPCRSGYVGNPDTSGTSVYAITSIDIPSDTACLGPAFPGNSGMYCYHAARIGTLTVHSWIQGEDGEACAFDDEYAIMCAVWYPVGGVGQIQVYALAAYRWIGCRWGGPNCIGLQPGLSYFNVLFFSGAASTPTNAAFTVDNQHQMRRLVSNRLADDLYLVHVTINGAGEAVWTEAGAMALAFDPAVGFSPCDSDNYNARWKSGSALNTFAAGHGGSITVTPGGCAAADPVADIWAGPLGFEGSVGCYRLDRGCFCCTKAEWVGGEPCPDYKPPPTTPPDDPGVVPTPPLPPPVPPHHCWRRYIYSWTDDPSGSSELTYDEMGCLDSDEPGNTSWAPFGAGRCLALSSGYYLSMFDIWVKSDQPCCTATPSGSGTCSGCTFTTPSVAGLGGCP